MRQNFAMTDVLQFLLFFWFAPGWLCTAGYFYIYLGHKSFGNNFWANDVSI